MIHARLPLISAPELMTAPLPERQFVLEPILTNKSLALIHGPRGLGKSFFALSLAWAVASGNSFLGWQAPRPHRVLYIDGETPMSEMRERMRMLGSMPPTLRFMLADSQESGFPDLGHYQGHKSLIFSWKNPELVIFDSIASLVGTNNGRADRWHTMQRFALWNRHHGRALLFIHHTNKRGQQRGSTTKEDVLDLVLALRRPTDYEPSEGARFEMHFDKARGLHGPDTHPIEASLKTAALGTVRWEWQRAGDAELGRMRALLGQGLNANEIARELGISKSKAYRMRERLVDGGR